MSSVLTSWKAIALYLSKGVRTVQRWELELGLPVRRTKRGVKSVVLAIPAELDEWVRLQQLPDGQRRSTRSERSTLLQLIDALQFENQDLRRQLALAHAKLIAIGI
jgi:hypothetical protein